MLQIQKLTDNPNKLCSRYILEAFSLGRECENFATALQQSDIRPSRLTSRLSAEAKRITASWCNLRRMDGLRSNIWAKSHDRSGFSSPNDYCRPHTSVRVRPDGSEAIDDFPSLESTESTILWTREEAYEAGDSHSVRQHSIAHGSRLIRGKYGRLCTH